MDVWPEEDNGVEAALEALSLLIEFVPDASDRLVASGGGAALANVACSEIVPEEPSGERSTVAGRGNFSRWRRRRVARAAPGASVQILASSTSGAATRLSHSRAAPRGASFA